MKRRRLVVGATVLVAAGAAVLLFREPEAKRLRPTVPAPRVHQPTVTHRHPHARPTQIERLIELGLPVYCAGRRGNMVALTFDDGPGPYTTLAVRILRRTHASASFFLVGRNIAAGGRVPRREAQLGDVGDHTWNHRVLPRLDARTMWTELARTQSAVRIATRRRVVFFRPPYGARNAGVDAASRRLGMLDVLWSVDSRDWAGASRSGIANAVAKAARPGSIVLMHENRGQTIRALRFSVLPALARRHLRAVSLTTLLTHDPPTERQLRRGSLGCNGPSWG